MSSTPDPDGGRATSALGRSSNPPSARSIRGARIPFYSWAPVNFLAEENMPWIFLSEWPEGVLGAAEELAYPVRHQSRQFDFKAPTHRRIPGLHGCLHATSKGHVTTFQEKEQTS